MGTAATSGTVSDTDSHIEGILYRRVIMSDSSTEDDIGLDFDVEWRPIKCILEGQVLTYFELDDSLRSENTQIVNEDVKVESEDPHTLELVLRIYEKNTGTSAKWVLRAGDISSFTVWTVVLKRAKRPKRSQSSICQCCQRGFGLLRKSKDCRQCGRQLCGACCHDLAFLPHLGYFDKQDVCMDCVQQPIVKRANATARTQRQTRLWLLCDCA